MKAVKIGVSLLILTILSYLPPPFLNLVLRLTVPKYVMFTFYVNNFANFFIYIWIDEKFRKFVCRC